MAAGRFYPRLFIQTEFSLPQSLLRWLCILLSCYTVAAQTPDTASVRGLVLDQNRALAADVQVTVTNQQTGLRRLAQTDRSGRFSFAGLPVSGTYEIKAVKPGFADAEQKDITLIGGATADLELLLNVAGQKTEISVRGVAGEIRTDGPQIGERLGKTELDETPLPNRKITYLPLLNAANRPAINQGDVFMNEDLFTTNGAGRRQTWFEIDGATGNDAWGRQTLFTNIPLAAVQEMTILVNDFSAEYGGSTGSAVNIVTKSGGNSFHGEALGLWRPSAPEARLFRLYRRQCR